MVGSSRPQCATPASRAGHMLRTRAEPAARSDARPPRSAVTSRRGVAVRAQARRLQRPVVAPNHKCLVAEPQQPKILDPGFPELVQAGQKPPVGTLIDG